MSVFIKRLIVLLLFLFTLEAKEIKIGMSADFSSSVFYLGQNMKVGIETYFKTYNKTSKHTFKLISYGDEYNPIIASQNVRKLIDKDKVVAFLGNVGTPTANVIVPILNEKQMVLFGAYSGGNILREMITNKYVFNYRASYSQEAYSIVSNLLKLGLKPDEIALFTQNDTYGDSGYTGALRAFQAYGVKGSSIIHGRYTRATNNIEIALSKMLDSEKELKAIVMVSVDEPTIKFINYAKEDFPNIKFFALSPANIFEVSKKINGHEKDLFVTQVVPLLSSNIKIVQEYKKNLKEFFPNEKANLISFEGYIVAKLFIKSLEGVDFALLNPRLVYRQLQKAKDVDIGLDFVSSFDNVQHQYSSKLWLSTMRKGKLLEVTWDEVFK